MLYTKNQYKDSLARHNILHTITYSNILIGGIMLSNVKNRKYLVWNSIIFFFVRTLNVFGVMKSFPSKI